MKKITTLLSAALLVGTIANAQAVRNNDLEVNVTSPTNNQVIAYQDSFYLNFSLTNNGPDAIPSGDTIVYKTTIDTIARKFNITQPIASGATINVNGFVAKNMQTTDLEAGFCIWLLDQSTISVDGLPIRVTYNDPNGSNDTACAQFTLKGPTTGILDANNAKYATLNLYPNPASTSVNFDFVAGANETVNVKVIDVTGKVINSQLINNNFSNKYTVDVTNVPNGVYFLDVTANDKKLRGKMVIAK